MLGPRSDCGRDSSTRTSAKNGISERGALEDDIVEWRDERNARAHICRTKIEGLLDVARPGAWAAAEVAPVVPLRLLTLYVDRSVRWRPTKGTSSRPDDETPITPATIRSEVLASNQDGVVRSPPKRGGKVVHTLGLEAARRGYALDLSPVDLTKTLQANVLMEVHCVQQAH